MKASDNQYPKVTFAESSAPSTPASGLGFLYEKSDGSLYFKNDAGVEFLVTGTVVAAASAVTASALVYAHTTFR